jgi:hypothetical protein
LTISQKIPEWPCSGYGRCERHRPARCR